MNLFRPFKPEAWQDLGVIDGRHLLRTPDGKEVWARQEDLPLTEVPPGKPYNRHIFPLWSFTSDQGFLGKVYRRSEAPIQDIVHALSLRDSALYLLRPIEAEVLRQNIPAGTYNFYPEKFRLTHAEGGGRIPLPDMPSVLPVLIQAAQIVDGTYDSYLVTGDEGLHITVPASRHARMARLAALSEAA